MEVTADSPCPHYEGIRRDVDRHQTWIGEVQTKLDTHCNGGGNHIQRREFQKLEETVEALRKTQETAVLTLDRITQSNSLLSRVWAQFGPPIIVALVLLGAEFLFGKH
jgi:hypothetical protein